MVSVQVRLEQARNAVKRGVSKSRVCTLLSASILSITLAMEQGAFGSFLDAVDWFLVVIVQHVFGPERVCRCLLKRRVSAIVVKTENRM